MNIGKTIRELREDQGLSQGDIERKFKISRPYLSRIEHSHRIPTLSTLIRIGDAIGVPAYEILRIAMESK
jgi:transcriptional regulator with XRE-family HTH domain